MNGGIEAQTKRGGDAPSRPRPRAMPFAIFLLSLFLGAVCLFLGPEPPASGDVRALMPLRSPALAALNRMEELFGTRIFDSIVISAPTELDDDLRERYATLSDEIAALPGVTQVFSPVEGYSRFRFPLRLRIPERGTARFLIEIESTLSDHDREVLDDKLEQVLASYDDLSPIRSGVFSLSEAATRAVQRENRIWTPVCLVSLIAVVGFIYRDGRAALAVLLPPVFSLIWVVAALLVFGIKLSPVSELVLPLLLVIGASYSSYVVARFVRAGAHRDSESLHGLRTGLLLAMATTVSGFLSLIPLDVAGVVQFGVIMSCGTVVAALLAVALPESILMSDRDALIRIDRAVNRFSLDGRHLLGRRSIALTTMVSLALAAGIPRIDVDTSPLDFLPKGGRELARFRAAGERFPGTHALAVVFERRAEAGPFNESDLHLIAEGARSLASLPNVAGVVSCGSFMDFDDQLKARGMRDDDAARFGPTSITTSDRRATRIVVETDNEGALLLDLSRNVDERLRERLPQGLLDTLRWGTVSRELVMAESSLGLSRGLLLSVATALGLVGALLFITFRSLRYAVVGILPSALPIGAIFGALGLLLPSVNLGASMVAAVALGMISDNTFHYTASFRAFQRTLPSHEAAERAFQASCSAFTATALILVIGFLPTTLSSLVPVQQFGGFLAISILLGLVTNGTFLPTMVERTLTRSADRGERN